MLERCALRAWPALASRDCMGWALRSANGYTKRANSANALVPAGDFEALRQEVEAHYARLRQPAIFRLSPLAPPGADAALETLGYTRLEPSLVMTAPLDQGATDPRVTISDRADEAWMRGFAEAASETPEACAHHAALHAAIEPGHAVAAVVHRGRPVAFGLAVADAARVGLFDIAVAPAHRGKGLGGAVSRALLDWGRRQGACSAFLQVVEANARARQLYAGLGFVGIYRYHYRAARRPPQLA